MATACQLSSPLNSENASPFGTCKVYLSCAEMALPPKTATTAAMIKIAENVVLFMTLSRAWRLQVKFGGVRSEFRGYEDWPVISISDNSGKFAAILGNPVMMD